MTDIIVSLISGVCFTICVWAGMVWFKLNEIKEVLNKIADVLEQNGKEKRNDKRT